MGGIARGGRGSSGEGESGGEDESGVRARMRVRVRSRRRARHSAHRGCHDRRQLESEALSRHDARGHCDVHGALRRADLKLACGRTHAAHTTDALWAVPPATEHTVAQHGTRRHCFGVTYSTWQPTAGSHALRHLHLHRALHGRCSLDKVLGTPRYLLDFVRGGTRGRSAAPCRRFLQQDEFSHASIFMCGGAR